MATKQVVDEQARKVLTDLVHKSDFLFVDFDKGVVEKGLSRTMNEIRVTHRRMTWENTIMTCIDRLEALAAALGYEFQVQDAQPAKVVAVKKAKAEHGS